MYVYELKLKVYVLKNIKNEDSLTCIGNLIDKSLLKDKFFLDFHKENIYKNYCYNSLWSIEKEKTYLAGNIYTTLIRTVDENLVKHLEKFLVNEHTEYLKALTIEKRIIPKKYIEKIYSITPVVMKFDNGYWKTNETLQVFEKRLKENLIKKFNNFNNTKINEDFEFFNFIKFDNHKPVATNYKAIKILGDKISLNVAENSFAQDIAYFALGTGIGEINARGLGFIGYKYL